MGGMYILDASGNPVHTEDPAVWVAWCDLEQTSIARVFAGGIEVATDFVPIDLSAGASAPVLFRTHIKLPCGSEGDLGHYRSRQAAIGGHRLGVKVIQRMLIAGKDVSIESINADLRSEGGYAHERETLSVFLEEGVPHQEAVIRALSEAGGYMDLSMRGEAGWVAIRPLMFTHAIISGIDELSHEGRWCYKDYRSAKAALDAWDGTGEPTGWHRHPKSGRRVYEDGRMEIAY
jgi:hypothetical protein